MHWHAVKVDALVKEYGSSERGLSDEDAGTGCKGIKYTCVWMKVGSRDVFHQTLPTKMAGSQSNKRGCRGRSGGHWLHAALQG